MSGTILIAEWNKLASFAETRTWRGCCTRRASRPQFIAYSVRDLPAVAPLLARSDLRAAAADLDRAQRR